MPGKEIIMESHVKKRFLVAAVLLVLFIAFTCLVMLTDVQAIGPQGTEVGFASVNAAVFESLGTNSFLEKATDLLGLVSIGVGFVFAFCALVQLIKRKSMKKIDLEFYVLGVYYLLLGILYVGFEKLALNFRPVLDEGELAASFPSSHTLLIVAVMGSAVLMAERYLKGTKWFLPAAAVAGALALFAIGGRLFSGVHWYTDIMGGVMLALALIAALDGVFALIKEKRDLKRAYEAAEASLR